MSTLRTQMIQDLQIVGLSERTQEAYVRSVRKLAEHDRQAPDQLSEKQVREYFLFLSQVTFLYKKSGSRRWRKMTVHAMEFIRRFLQHVLPTGFQKVRHYGFLSPQSKTNIDAVRWLVSLYYDQVFVLLCHVQDVGIPRPKLRCAICGGPLVVTGFVSPPDCFPRGPPDERSAA